MAGYKVYSSFGGKLLGYRKSLAAARTLANTKSKKQPVDIWSTSGGDFGMGKVVEHVSSPSPRTKNHRRRNGRSYARKGVSIGVPRHGFTPKVGDKFYVSGQLVTIKRKDGDGMLWFNKDVDGTVAMSESNLYQAAYVPEDSPFAPYEYRIKKNPTPVRLKVGRKIYNGMAKKVNGRVKVFVTPAVARKINPDRKYSIADIRAANRAAGFHFFGRGAMKFFNSKIYPGVYQGPGGIYFVTGEYMDAPSSTEYTVRKFNESTGNIGVETRYPHKEDAIDHAKRASKRSV